MQPVTFLRCSATVNTSEPHPGCWHLGTLMEAACMSITTTAQIHYATLPHVWSLYGYPHHPHAEPVIHHLSFSCSSGVVASRPSPLPPLSLRRYSLSSVSMSTSQHETEALSFWHHMMAYHCGSQYPPGSLATSCRIHLMMTTMSRDHLNIGGLSMRRRRKWVVQRDERPTRRCLHVADTEIGHRQTIGGARSLDAATC
jgi:hypothetical protein